jgi:putative component of membrane protein insertase Oxa1/YidC/SpoIIIJ protein YidD
LGPGRWQPSWLGIERIRIRCDPFASEHGLNLLRFSHW